MKQPDRNKPRRRWKDGGTLNRPMVKKFNTKFKEHGGITQKQYGDIIKCFHTMIKDTAMTNPHGVVLPHKIGVLMLRKSNNRKTGIDYKTSLALGKVVRYKGMETDNHRVQITYINNISKCVVKHKHLLYFIPIRSFKKEVSEYFLKNWQRILTTPVRVKNIINV